jgi:ribosomal subunit interface protein
MKLNVQHHNLRSTHELDSLLEQRIFKLEPRLQIDEACVRLECRWEKSPAYRVAIHIATPGPDLKAEGRDHTVRAAIGKAFLDLEDRLRDREHKSIWRVRSNLHTPAALRAGRRLR